MSSFEANKQRDNVNALIADDFKRDAVSTEISQVSCLNFGPVPLSVFQKELEEAENEPFPTCNISFSEYETDDMGDLFSDSESDLNIQEEKSNSFNADVKINVSYDNDSLPSIPEEELDNITESKENLIMQPINNLGLHDKSQNNVGFGVTPAKTKPVNNFFTPNVKFVTPRSRTVPPLAKFTPSRTPKSYTSDSTEQQGPRIQCTINVGSFLNTPLTKMTAIKRNTYRPINTEKSYVPIVQVNGALQERRSPKSSTQTDGILREKSFNITNNGNTSTAAMDDILQDKIWIKPSSDKVCVYSLGKEFTTITVRKVNYIVLNQLGVGGSSVVFNCFDPATKTMRAIKRVNLSGDKSLVTGYINEVKLLEKLQKCERIIKMYSYEIVESERLLLMVLEKGDADLSKIIKDISSNNDRLPTHKLVYYWMEMLCAVKEIHDNDVIHSDLKPANFLQVSLGLKLIDFGIASCIQSDMTSIIKNVPVGSFNYISPEALSNDGSGTSSPKYRVSFKSDVWSLGCILYQLVYRKTPFQHIGHPYAKMSAIVDPKQQIKYPELDGVPACIINTIKLCLQYDMRARPSVHELIKMIETIYKFE